MSCCAVLCSVVLCCVVLYCVVLCYVILFYIMLCYIIFCILLCCVISYFVVLYCLRYLCHLFNTLLFRGRLFVCFIHLFETSVKHDLSSHPTLCLYLSFPLLHRQMTHGVIHKLTSSGRIADCWEGATAEISKRLGNASHNLVDRQGEELYNTHIKIVIIVNFRPLKQPNRANLHFLLNMK